MSIEAFPIEVLQKIFSHFRYYGSEYEVIRKVCHRWSDAVEYLLMPRTYLKLAVEKTVRPDYIDEDDELYDLYDSDITKTEVIDKGIFLASTRKYTSFKIEVCNEETDEVKKALKEVLIECQKRYQIERLILRGSPNKTLVQLFRRHHSWLQNLTYLEVWLLPVEASKGGAGAMITLPNLKRLYWHEGTQVFARLHYMLRTDRGKTAFPLNAPALSSLTVHMDEEQTRRNQLESARQDPDVCCLFLPTLELKAGTVLKHLDLHGILELNQRHIDGSERVLANVEQLDLNDCDCDVMIRICHKCPNLKKLAIYNERSASMPLQISPTLTTNLQQLIICNWAKDGPLVLHGPAVFSKLQYIHLDKAELGTRPRASLYAPQLTTIKLSDTHFLRSILTHTAQLRTMSLQVLSWNEQELHPQLNVTDLTLAIAPRYEMESRMVQKYLESVPHLTRLKLDFATPKECWSSDYKNLSKINLAFIDVLPKLEHLTICHAEMRLPECTKLAGLKSLFFQFCIINVDPADEPAVVILTALEHVRVDRVKVNGLVETGSFPIQFNERQPPIVVARYQPNVFSSNQNF